MSRVVGVDPSSSTTGVALARDLDLIRVDTFVADKELPIETNMHRFRRSLEAAIDFNGGCEIMVVEKVSVTYNLNTVRKIAYFEAMAMLVGAEVGARVIQVQATKARKRVFGAGNLKKEVAHDRMVAMFPDMGWAPKLDGGMDETDAACCALAGESLARDPVKAPPKKPRKRKVTA